MPTYIARHHAEWLSLVEVSGPFLSMPVLMRIFPQGLDALDPALVRMLRPAYEEWAENQSGPEPDPAIHTQWLRFVLANVLDIPLQPGPSQDRAALVTGTQLPPALFVTFKEHGERLSPDYALLAPGGGKACLLIQQYAMQQDLNRAIPGRQWKDSPALRMMQLLRATGVRLGLLTNGEHWMLVDAPRNETTAFISWYAHLWLEESLTLRAFRSLLHCRRFFGVAPDETLEAMLAESASNQQEVTDQLGFQVRRAVEVLIHALDRLDRENNRALLATMGEADLYEAALTVMMRLVFLLAAEERKMLPLGEALYDQYYAAATLQAQLREQADQYGEEVLERRYDAWSRLLALFRLVYGGVEYPDLRLPAYDGRLFDPDRFPFLEGRLPGTTWREEDAQPLLIDNRTVLHLLEALQLLQVRAPGSGQTEARRLSFRALDIEQIGHVYEGLLDHTARRASEPMLALTGAGQDGVEIPLSKLEGLPSNELIAFLQEKTGRSASALQRALAYKPDAHQRMKLKAACDDDEVLLRRVLPFAGLLRSDSFGNPLVITTGALYMTTGADRRVTGTHYTPRSLTEPLVKHTLDPLVYIGPAEGWPEEQWQLRKPAEILNLKVCDMAMGSGAFLVQSCRYLSEKLVEAWEIAELWLKLPHGFPRITPEGQPATGALGETLIPKDTEERLALARRLIAERCLYGVDKNPMAVEMAKLSLWLITLDKGRPFTFLDHALCCGDSLLGVNIKQLTAWSLEDDTTGEQARQMVWIQPVIKDALDTALKMRRRLRLLPDEKIEQIEEKRRLLTEAEEAMALVKLGADLLIATTLHGYAKNNKASSNNLPTMQDYSILVSRYEDARRHSLTAEAWQALRDDFAAMRARVDALLGERRPFHWELAYPEAFVEAQDGEPGFSALLSNPPFQGGSRITGTLGIDYREYLVNHLAQGKRGNADLCAFFFLRATDLIRPEGQCALLATNTIAQGDTREVGLEQIMAAGWRVPRAISSRKWPGTASLEVAEVWLRRGDWQGPYWLDEQPVEGITPFLASPGTMQGKPYKLATNVDNFFEGSKVYGIGFVLAPEEARALIEKDPRNRDVLFPYLNAEDLNSRPDQSPSRWVINFHDWPLEVAETYPDCMRIVRKKVKPERDRLGLKADASAKGYAKLWWQYGRRAIQLYNSIHKIKRVLVIPRVSKYMICTWEPVGIVYSEATCVIASEADADFAIIQSTFHDYWARFCGSTLETRMRYTPSDCLETFPFPASLQGLDEIGQRYYEHRQSIMRARQEGLTKTYNRFHDPQETAPDIALLRELHRAMDQAVAAAYGWHDLDLGHGFHQTKQGVRYTISEEARREALGRLLRLNHERYAAEVAQTLHDRGAKTKNKGKGKAKKAAPTPAAEQMTLDV